MHMPAILDPTIREALVVDDPEAMRLLLSGKYNTIMDLIDTVEMSVSDIARTMKINPGSAHYHLKELEKYGLVKIVREETKGNIVKKYYRTAARTIYLDGSRFKISGGDDPMIKYRDQLVELLAPFGYDIPEGLSGPFKDALKRYDRRRKELLREIQDVRAATDDDLLSRDTFMVALRLKEIEDKEIQGIQEEIRAILSKHGEGK